MSRFSKYHESDVHKRNSDIVHFWDSPNFSGTCLLSPPHTQNLMYTIVNHLKNSWIDLKKKNLRLILLESWSENWIKKIIHWLNLFYWKNDFFLQNSFSLFEFEKKCMRALSKNFWYSFWYSFASSRAWSHPAGAISRSFKGGVPHCVSDVPHRNRSSSYAALRSMIYVKMDEDLRHC